MPELITRNTSNVFVHSVKVNATRVGMIVQKKSTENFVNGCSDDSVFPDSIDVAQVFKSVEAGATNETMMISPTVVPCSPVTKASFCALYS